MTNLTPPRDAVDAHKRPRKRHKRNWWQLNDETGDWRRRARWWTPDRYWTLLAGIENGWSDDQIARKLGTTAVAVHLARKRAGLPSRTSETLNTRSVARLLGVGCAKTIARWIKDGWLQAHQGQRRGGNRQWVIQLDDVQEFLVNPDYWHCWHAERITDTSLRTWAQTLPKPRYLTPGQVAGRLCVEHATVSNWIRIGELPAVRYGNYWIAESDLENFTPPCQRTRQPRPVTSYEVQQIHDLRSKGCSLTEISRTLNRPNSVIYRRYSQSEAAVAS